MDILENDKIKSVKLADGQDYTLPIINMTTLANIEKSMGIGGKELAEKIQTEPMSTIRLFAWAVLKESYPELKLEEAGKLITLKELKEFTSIISILTALS